MTRVKKKRGKILIKLDDGQEIIIDGVKEISATIKMLEANEELDFHEARGIIDTLSAMRQEIISRREKRCIRDSSSTRLYGPRGRSC